MLDFAKRYVRNYGAIENEAESMAQAWDARYAASGSSPYGGAQLGSYGNAYQSQSASGSAYGSGGQYARQPYGAQGQYYGQQNYGSSQGYSQRPYGAWGQYNQGRPMPGWRRNVRRYNNGNGYGYGYGMYNQRRRF